VAKSSAQLKAGIWIAILLTWSMACYAAEARTLAQGLSTIPIQDIGVVLVLAIVGGVTGTLVKLAKRDVVIVNLVLEVAKDTMASIVVGLLAFFATNWWEDINLWAQAVLILLGGYGGSKVLDVLLDEGGIPWLRLVFTRLFGRTADPVKPREETPP
jgi:hypothetical protein